MLGKTSSLLDITNYLLRISFFFLFFSSAWNSKLLAEGRMLVRSLLAEDEAAMLAGGV